MVKARRIYKGFEVEADEIVDAAVPHGPVGLDLYKLFLDTNWDKVVFTNSDHPRPQLSYEKVVEVVELTAEQKLDLAIPVLAEIAIYGSGRHRAQEFLKTIGYDQ